MYRLLVEVAITRYSTRCHRQHWRGQRTRTLTAPWTHTRAEHTSITQRDLHFQPRRLTTHFPCPHSSSVTNTHLPMGKKALIWGWPPYVRTLRTTRVSNSYHWTGLLLRYLNVLLSMALFILSLGSIQRMFKCRSSLVLSSNSGSVVGVQAYSSANPTHRKICGKWDVTRMCA